jgi:hypothetical protein
VAAPIPSQFGDSALAFAVADALRDEIAKSPDRRVLPFREMCTWLRAAEYSCDSFITGAEVAQLADAARADAYVTGRLARDGDLVLELRIRSRGRTGYAGTFQVHADTLWDADSVAALSDEGLNVMWRAAAHARACYDARDAARYEEALESARAANALMPNHSMAALCSASVMELTHQPLPSLIAAYEQALAGDPELSDARHRLGMLHLQNGDTLSANVLLSTELRQRPHDLNLRQLVLYNWIAVGQPDSAFAALYPDAGPTGDNLALLQMISRLCLQREMWYCEFEALKRQYRLNPGLAGDTAFYYRIIGAAQHLGDASGVIRWTDEAVEHAQRTLDSIEAVARDARRQVRSLWMAHAGALTGAGARDSGVAVYLGLWRSDTTDIRPYLAAAQALADPRSIGVDSARPLDTAALRSADSILQDLAGRRGEPDVLQTIATIYFAPGAAMVQAKVAPAIASAWLENAIRHDVRGRMRQTGNSLNGLALFYVVQRLDARIRRERACALVDEMSETIARARSAITTGYDAFPDMAEQVLQGLDSYESVVPQYRQALGCGRPDKPETSRFLQTDAETMGSMVRIMRQDSPRWIAR